MKKREVCFDEDRSGDVSNMVSRRQLLKALAATSGAVVAAQLPTEWAKPVVEVGILPAHAQASAVVTLSNLQKTFTGLNDCTTSQGSGSSNIVSFDYNDPLGNLAEGSTVLFTTNFMTSVPAELDIFNLPGVTVVGDAFQGTISIQLCTRFGDNTTATNQVQIRNAQGQLSNIETITVSAPLGAEESAGDGTEDLP